MAQPTAFEQYFLELVNRARLDPAAEAARLGIGLNDGLAAGTITTAAKAPLAFNPLLIDAAEAHSAWMLATDTFSHTGANGSSPGDRMAAAGYAFGGSWSWGENISIRWGGTQAITPAAIDAFHDGLFRSPGHRTNIENAGFREIGIGVQAGEYQGSNGLTATEDFARSGTRPSCSASPSMTGTATMPTIRGRGWAASRSISAPPRGSSGTWPPGMPAAGSSRSRPGPTASPSPAAGSPRRWSGRRCWARRTSSSTSTSTWRRADGAARDEAAETLTGTAAGELIQGLGGDDALRGLGGDDTLEGGAGGDRLYGDAGNDRLVGGGGPDILTGGTGADRFVFLGLGDRRDAILDFSVAEGDRLDVAALFPAGPHAGQALLDGGYVRFLAGSGLVRVQVDADGGGDAWVTLTTLNGLTSTAGLSAAVLIA